MQREVVLDTETTGLDPRIGDRLIEVACVELLNRIPTGREFHTFVNPEGRQVHADALAVHGISNDFLEDKPLFRELAEPFLAFLGDAALVIHNAAFDLGFLNAEFERLGRPPLTTDRVVDTLALARRKHPAGPNSLDALCKRYRIDNSKRTKHGALMDAALLAEVYLELLGERQAMLGLVSDVHAEETAQAQLRSPMQRQQPLAPRLTADDDARHRAFVATLGPNALWRRYFGATNE